MTSSDDIGKIFIGGLGWETTKEALQDYFSQFGEISDCVVMKNAETGRSRGFGFVTFSDPDCVFKVLQSKPHELNGRTIDAKQCTPRTAQKGRRAGNQGKLFLGGLPPDITEDELTEAFSSFGKISNINIMIDQQTKKCRGFGFLAFESEDSTEQACNQRYVHVNGKKIECKRAEPRNNQSNGQGGGGGYGNSYGRQGGGYGNGGGYQQGGWDQSQQYGGQDQGYGNYQNYANPNAAYGGNYQAMYAMQNAQYAAAYSNYAAANAGSYDGSDQKTAATGYTDPNAAYTQTAYAQQTPELKASSTQGYGSYSNQTSSGRDQAYHPYRR